MSRPSDALSCLREDTVLAVIDGSIGAGERQAIEEHLGSCAACLRLVAVFSDAGDGSTTPPGEPKPRAPLAPAGPSERLARYEVSGPIGAGGMGVVYSAWDPELGRPVALKLLRAELSARKDSRGRVLREAQAMARLKHPNVVAIYDVGTFREQVFIAMELVEGGTLRRWTSAAPRSWREVLQAYLHAGRGLAAAHAAGLVHRDFKPDNVLVASDGRVLVTDFGMARLAESELLPTPANMTLTSGSGSGQAENAARGGLDAATPGSRFRSPLPAYDSPAHPFPQAFFPSDSQPTPATLVGSPLQLPFNAASFPLSPAPFPAVSPSPRAGPSPNTITPIGGLIGTPAYMSPEQMRGARANSRSDLFAFCTSLYEGLAGHRPYPGNDLAAICKRAESGVLEAAKEKLPRWLLRELVRGLQPDPAKRHASIEELLRALERGLQPRGARLGRIGLFALGLVAALALAFIAADRSGLLHRLHRLRGLTPGERRASELCDHARQELRDHGRIAAAEAFRQANAEVPDNPRILTGYASALLEMGANTQAVDILGHAYLLRDELPEEERGELETMRLSTQGKGEGALARARALYEQAPQEISRGMFYAKELGYLSHLPEQLALIDKLHQLPAPAGNDPLLDQIEAVAANSSAQFPRALAAARRSFATFEQRGEKVGMARAKLLEMSALRRQGADPEQVRLLVDQTISLARSAGDLSDVALAEMTLQTMQLEAGQLAEAKASLEDAGAIFKASGAQINVAGALYSLSSLLRRERDFPAAIERIGEAQRLYLELGDHRRATVALTAMADLRMEIGELSAAADAFDQALAFEQKLQDPSLRLSALTGLAVVRIEQGDRGEARKRLDEANSIAASSSKRAAVPLAWLAGMLAFYDGKYSEAEAAAKSTVKLALGIGNLDQAAEGEAQLSRALLEEGKLRESREALVRGQALNAKAKTGVSSGELLVAEGRLLAKETAKEAPGDRARADAVLEKALAQAVHSGVAVNQWEARLALAETRAMKKSKAERRQAREQLEQIERQAHAQGYGLYAQLAHAAPTRH